jgi:3-methyladenine DNA glycosylase/8-oxoguanine DNA glycosylase
MRQSATPRRPIRPTAVVTITPPRLSSFPQERDQLEFSSRSLVFASDGDRVLRAWGPPDRPWVLAVEGGRTRWTASSYGAGPAETRDAARALFSLDHPIEQFYGLVRGEPVLGGTERRFRGLRLPRDAGVYEALFHSILGQQVSVAAANTIQRRIMEAAGARLEVEGTTVPRVPTPAELVELGVDGLRANGASGAKARSLLALAEWQTAGRWSPERLHPLSTAALVEVLDGAPGVGRWTAENAVLRGLGRTDVFVAGDLGVRLALAAYGAVASDAKEATIRAWADARYPGWGSYATLYLWRKWGTEGAPRAAKSAG